MSETTILIAALAFGLLAYVRIASHSRGFSVLIVLLLAAAASCAGSRCSRCLPLCWRCLAMWQAQ